MKRNFRSFITD